MLQSCDWDRICNAYRCAVERANKGVSLSILGCRHWSLRLEYRVNTSHCAPSSVRFYQVIKL